MRSSRYLGLPENKAKSASHITNPFVSRNLTFWSTPVTLPDKKVTADSLRIYLPGFLVHDRLLCLHDSPRLALIVDTNDLVSQLEFLASARCWKGLQDGEFTLAIDHSTGVELRNTRDGRTLRARVEIGDFLVCEFESWLEQRVSVSLVHWKLRRMPSHTKDQRVGREDSEIGMKFLCVHCIVSEMIKQAEQPEGLSHEEKMQLICFAADAVREQQDIAFLPGNFLGREFVTSSGC